MYYCYTSDMLFAPLNGCFESIRCLINHPYAAIHYLNDIRSKLSGMHLQIIGIWLLNSNYNCLKQQILNLNHQWERIKKGIQCTLLFIKLRKRIEKLFSQLCDLFKIRNNYTKPFEWFKTIILSKTTSLTAIKVINKFVFNININNLKILIN